MGTKYKKLLEQVKIGNVVLKNRMISSNALPHFLIGPEDYPSETFIQYQANVAKNGAAVVTTLDWSNPLQRKSHGDGAHFPSFDLTNPAVENYMNQLADGIHFYGSKASVAVMPVPPHGYTVCDTEHSMFFPGDVMDDEGMPGGPGGPPEGEGGPGEHEPPEDEGDMMLHFPPAKGLTVEMMREIIRKYVGIAKKYQSFGFDMMTVHMAYRSTILARFLSPLDNKRTDEYGGSLENRVRFPLEFCKAIKEACGQDFLIEAQISGEEDEGGITVEDTVAFAKMAEGIIDIFQIRAKDGDLNHPTGFNSGRTPVTLHVAEAIKKSGAKVLTAPIGGFQDVELAEQYLEEGKMDMFCAGRAFICEPEYYEKILENRAEDITPCIRCNRCHGQNMQGPWISVCSVNPTLGIRHRLPWMVEKEAKNKKNIAVIGGGCAGMNAAVIASRRGHTVSLFEKNERLGGQLNQAGYASFKWPIGDFKEYLIRQLEKSAVEVHLGVAVTPELLKHSKYDAIIVAIGATPKMPSIEGVFDEKGNVVEGIYNPIEVYGNESALGNEVVIVGGGETGTETGLHLAKLGHKVTVLTRKRRIAQDAERVHYYESFKAALNEEKNFRSITRANTVKVTAKSVEYVDKTGEKKVLNADSVIVCGGMDPLRDEGLAFSGLADEVVLIGDCEKVGDIQKAMRRSFAAASYL